MAYFSYSVLKPSKIRVPLNSTDSQLVRLIQNWSSTLTSHQNVVRRSHWPSKTPTIQRSDAKVKSNSCTSATSGNNVNVSQVTAAGNNVRSKSKPKANQTADSVHGDGNSISDEDNSIER